MKTVILKIAFLFLFALTFSTTIYARQIAGLCLGCRVQYEFGGGATVYITCLNWPSGCASVSGNTVSVGCSSCRIKNPDGSTSSSRSNTINGKVKSVNETLIPNGREVQLQMEKPIN